MKDKLKFAICASLLFGLSGFSTAQAVIINLAANMDCAQADAGAGTCVSGGTGTGIGTMTYDTVTGLLSWNVSHSGLSGAVTAAHFHGPAQPNQSAGIQVGIGILNPAISSMVIAPAQAAELLAGQWYINIHSNSFPAGEVRGQVDVISTPTCDIQLNQSTYVDGDTVTADVFRIANLTANPVDVVWKVWLGVPGIPPIGVVNVGADGSFVLSAGTDVDLGPLPILPVSAALPRGSYEFSCRMLEPVTGELLAENLNTFDISTCPASGWVKYQGNPIFSSSGPGEWDDPLDFGTMLIDQDEPVNKYKRWYVGGITVVEGGMSIGYATSADGINWVPYSNNPVMTHGNTWDINGFSDINVIKDGATYQLWFGGIDNNGVNQIGYATSPDGINWTPDQSNPVFSPGIHGAWDDSSVAAPSIIKEGSNYKMWYQGVNQVTDISQIGLATSADGINWQRSAGNPVLSPNQAILWESSEEGIGNPTVIKTTSGYTMAYDGADPPDFHRIGLATSSDGTTWTRNGNNPILDVGSGNAWDSAFMFPETLIEESSHLKLWFQGLDFPETTKVGFAESCVSSL